MVNLILYLNGRTLSALSFNHPTTLFQIADTEYSVEEEYFGDWMLIRDEALKIVGFKIIPLCSNAHLIQHILPTNFVRNAQNIKVDEGVYIYLSIYLATRDVYVEDEMNRMAAAVLKSSSGEIAIKLDGFTEADLNDFGFNVK